MIGSGFRNITKIPELKKRIYITLGLLAVYRIGVFIPTPGVDSVALGAFFSGLDQSLLNLINMFSGGALERFSVFALGIMPYISASIILQLLTVVIPHLERLSKEGEQGRKKITQYTRYGTVVISVVQGFFIAVGLEQMASPGGESIVIAKGWNFRIMTVLTLTAGTAFIMWLGEQITERGIGNGISLIIFSGIVARFPAGVSTTLQKVAEGDNMDVFKLLILVAFMIGVIAFIIFVEQGQRRIPIQYAKRVVGRRMYGGQSTFLPLKVNTAGVIPPIFASSVMMFPTTIGQFVQNDWLQRVTQSLSNMGWAYQIPYVVMIIFFCFFYTAVTFNPVDVADNLKKYGGYIPGIRPGKRTADYIDKVLTRITVGGALYVSAVCVLPAILMNEFNVTFYFGGTALLIVVGVAIDTISQIESHMHTRHYEGFLKKGVRGRGR